MIGIVKYLKAAIKKRENKCKLRTFSSVDLFHEYKRQVTVVVLKIKKYKLLYGVAFLYVVFHNPAGFSCFQLNCT